MTKKYETFHRDYELCECAVPAVYCHGCNSMNDPSHVEGGHCGDCGEERVGVILANHGHYSCPTTCGKCSGKGYLRVRPATSRPPCAACAVIIDKIDALIDLCAATWITDELKTIRALAASGDGEVGDG